MATTITVRSRAWTTPCGHIGRGPDDGPGADITRVITDDHPRLSRDDQIKFVRPGMHVNLLRLARLKAIEPDEQLAACEEIGLGRLVRG